MAVYPEPVFINTDPNEVASALIAAYEAATGKTLSQAEAERLVLNCMAYREGLLRSGINDSAKLNLVRFSFGVILDYLAENVGVRRLPAQPAVCDIDFTLVTGHGAVVIPLGLRVASQDGKAVFRTTVATPVGIGIDNVTISCECEAEGVIGNGYIAGNVSTILDPQSYLATAANNATTAGGVEKEDDEQLKNRVYLAPSSFSSAISKDGYKYWTRSASTSIIDVEVFSLPPGTVNVYPLTLDAGGTPAAIIDKVDATLQQDKIRAINDNVVVTAPSSSTYAIDIDVVLFDTADQPLSLTQIQAAAQSFADSRRKKLGLDVIIDQLKGMVVLPGIVYSVTVNQPVVDILLNKTQYGECTGITINITGLSNG